MSNSPMPSMNPLSTFLNSVEMVQKAWPSFNLPSQFAPTMDVKELDKRLNDLKAVEQWLALNLKMLQGTIEGLELQRNAIAALNEFGKSTAQTLSTAQSLQPQTPAPPEPEPKHETATSITAALPDISSQVNPAAWWSLLQSQFTQIAEAALRPTESPAMGGAAASKRPRKSAASGGASTAAKSAQTTRRMAKK